MGRITNIVEQRNNSDRLNIYINNSFCCGVRKRTFDKMNLDIGSEITCEQLKEKESFFWKEQYGSSAWEKEKVRLEKVKHYIESIDSNLLVNIVGFGADSLDIIKDHPKEQGKPDLEVINKFNSNLIVFIEVTGSEKLRGDDYWIRPDKLTYCQNHPNDDVWIILHFAEPTEKLVFIKPKTNKKYTPETITIRDVEERMCIVDPCDSEIKSDEYFKSYIKSKLTNGD